MLKSDARTEKNALSQMYICDAIKSSFNHISELTEFRDFHSKCILNALQPSTNTKPFNFFNCTIIFENETF